MVSQKRLEPLLPGTPQCAKHLTPSRVTLGPAACASIAIPGVTGEEPRAPAVLTLSRGHVAQSGVRQDSHPGRCAFLLCSHLAPLPLFCPTAGAAALAMKEHPGISVALCQKGRADGGHPEAMP